MIPRRATKRDSDQIQLLEQKTTFCCMRLGLFLRQERKVLPGFSKVASACLLLDREITMFCASEYHGTSHYIIYAY
jgi:hypothetical protein